MRNWFEESKGEGKGFKFKKREVLFFILEI